MEAPKIFTKNYVDKDAVLTSTHDETFLDYLRDRDNESQYISDGANSDATEVTLTVTFMSGDAEIEREIDTLMLLNHNLEDPIAEYWDGDSWESLDSETNLTDGTATVMSFNAVTTSRVRIRNSQTITPDQEKAVGELVICKLLLNLGALLASMTSYQMSSRNMATDVKTADGSVVRTYIKHAPNRTEKYEARAQFDFVNVSSELPILRSVKESGEIFTWQPESEARPDEVYQVHWYGAFAYKYNSSYKGSGVSIALDLKEA